MEGHSDGVFCEVQPNNEKVYNKTDLLKAFGEELMTL